MTAQKATHTPGPWHVGEGNARRIIFDQRGWAIADAKLWHGKHADGEDYANAHLLAAAPDLLAALKAVLSWIDDYCETTGFYAIEAQADAAIAKAERSPL